MFKFIFITDLHLKTSNPSNRIDDYTETLFKKLTWVLNFAKKKKIKNILCGGDILDTPSPSDE